MEYNDFIRTTDERHEKVVQKIFRQFYEQGDIYKGSYEGLYCTPCEAFWTPTQVVEKDGVKCCPDCGRPVEPMQRGKLLLPHEQISGLAAGLSARRIPISSSPLPAPTR